VWENVLQETGSLYGARSLAYIRPRGHHINIDEEDDFLLAEALLEKGIVKREL
jgi:CMP-N-acetylneuraminic acid synthetase